MEKRSGLVVARELTPADGCREQEVALRMAGDLPGVHQEMFDPAKGHATRDVVADLRCSDITLQVA